MEASNRLSRVPNSLTGRQIKETFQEQLFRNRLLLFQLAWSLNFSSMQAAIDAQGVERKGKRSWFRGSRFCELPNSQYLTAEIQRSGRKKEISKTESTVVHTPGNDRGMRIRPRRQRGEEAKVNRFPRRKLTVCLQLSQQSPTKRPRSQRKQIPSGKKWQLGTL